MPATEKRHTLLRQWELLKAIPAYQENPTGKSARQLAEALTESGFEVDIRTVQRDLQELSALFPIEANEKSKPFGWRWLKGAHAGMPGMSVAEALSIKLVEQHLTQLLPGSMLSGMTGLFKEAGKKLNALQGSNPASSWLDKVCYVSPMLPMLTPQVDSSIQDTLSEALLRGRQVKAKYRPAEGNELRDYTLHPLSMILRGGRAYLVAKAFDYLDIRLYALHRFVEVEMLGDTIEAPPGFDLDQELERGLAEFGDRGEVFTLEMTCTPDLAAQLAETPISVDQNMSLQPNGNSRVTTSVRKSWQLNWWLLSQGAKVEVISPDWLRDEIWLEIGVAEMQYDLTEHMRDPNWQVNLNI